MSEFTILRVDVDGGVVARVLDAVPGVTVAADETPSGDEATTASTATAAGRFTTEETQCGPAADRVAEDDGEETSALREWGLLGVGVSLVLLGVATVGIWWYRRQSGDGDGDAESAETPPPTAASDSGETAVEETHGTPAPADSSSRGASVSSTVLDEDSPSTADEPEPTGRTEDRSNVEWTPRDTGGRETDSDSDTQTADDPSPRPGGTVDVAPLLGVAFLAVSGAVVRWIRGGKRDEQ